MARATSAEIGMLKRLLVEEVLLKVEVEVGSRVRL